MDDRKENDFYVYNWINSGDDENTEANAPGGSVTNAQGMDGAPKAAGTAAGSAQSAASPANSAAEHSSAPGSTAGAAAGNAGYGAQEQTGPQYTAQQPERKKPGVKRFIAFITAVMLFCAAAGLGEAMLGGGNTGSGGGTLGNILQLPESITGKADPSDRIKNGGDEDDPSAGSIAFSLDRMTDSQLTIQEIVARNQDAVVEIRTEKVAYDYWYGQYVTEGAGSGVIITGDGYIVTNNHVIEGATKVTVTLHNGEDYEAEIIGTDENEDIAVIKIDASGLTAAVPGDSSKIRVGQLAVAIGNPLGKLGGTATAGIISALDRKITIDGKTMTLLQTDASINPGNSGGGLFDGSGRLIGIVNAKSTGSDVEGLGFAIPINTAMEKVEYIMDHPEEYQKKLQEKQEQNDNQIVIQLPSWW